MSVMIEIFERAAKITASNDVLSLLNDILTREVEGAEFIKRRNNGKGWDGKYRFYSKISNTVAPGIVPYVVKLLEKMGEKVSVSDKRWTFPLRKSDIVNLQVYDKKKKKCVPEAYRDYQIDSIVRLSKNAGGLIHIATNGGKSFIITGLILSIIEKSPLKALVLVHRKELLTQTVDLFLANCDKEVVGQIAANKIEVEGKQIVVAMVQTLNKRLSKLGDKATRDDEAVLNYVQDTGILVIDEVHHATAKTYKKIIKTIKKCMIKTGFSGTIPSTKDIAGLELRGMLGAVVKRIKNKELIDRGISLIPKVFMFYIPLADMTKFKKQCKKDYFVKRTQEEKDPYAGMGGYVFQRVYEEGIVYNQLQTGAVINVTKMLIKKKLQVLIIVNRKETHGVELSATFDEHDIKHVVWTGDTKDKDRADVQREFGEKETPVMIATSVVDEGLNIHAIDCIILASGLKAHVQLLQRLGRGLRTGSSNKYLLVIDFFHQGEKSLTSHSKQRLRLWKDEQLDVACVDNVTELEELLEPLVL